MGGTAAWNLLFEGQKLWCFAPPGSQNAAPPGVSARALDAGVHGDPRLFYSAPAALPNLAMCAGSANDRLLWALQEPGDLIFIPSGWWHTTVCLTETSAYTRNYINSHNFRRAVDALSKLHPRMA